LPVTTGYCAFELYFAANMNICDQFDILGLAWQAQLGGSSCNSGRGVTQIRGAQPGLRLIGIVQKAYDKCHSQIESPRRYLLLREQAAFVFTASG
jgi:hypothetical protein